MTTAAWSTLEPALSALFKRIATVGGVIPSVAGSVAPSVVDARGLRNKVPAPSNPTTLHWTIEAVQPVGRAELREEYDPDTLIAGDTYEPDPEDPEARLGAIIVTSHGQSTWTIELRAESSNQSKPAVEHIRALVESMRLPSVADELEAIGLAYTAWDEITDDTYDDEEGRAVSVHIARVFFNGSSFRQDAPITTIERAKINGVITP